ncbi:MAG TPA: META domain-containing protein [Candidatus Paceibacterota bacterium]|nr:META domain-containing protein [Candidatus Paceibacterota bacterium]
MRTKNVVVILLILLALLIVWASANREIGRGDDPAGTYIAFVPAPAFSWETISLHLSPDAARSAVMTRDYQDGRSVVVQRGSWAHEGGGNISIALGADPKLLFSMEGNALQLGNLDSEAWGVVGLELSRAALPLESEWLWIGTTRNGEELAPTLDAPFVLKLGADLHLSVTGDCNAIGGDFGLREGGKMVIGPLTSTKMFCEGSLETEFLDALSSTESYLVRDGTLTLTLKDDEGSTRFTRYSGVTTR